MKPDEANAFIKGQYRRLVEQHIALFENGSIDFIGINISEMNTWQFKVYLKPSACLDDRHPWIDGIREAGMLRTLTRIERPGISDVQYDIGLSHRTDEHMLGLLEKLGKLDFIGVGEIRETEALASMKVCDDPTMRLSALYFLGLQEDEQGIKQAKLHFLTRICEDPDRIGDHPRYNDDYYLDYLRDQQLRGFQEISVPARALLERINGHLWMFGVDYARNGQRKRKIYVKSKATDLMDKAAAVLTGETPGMRPLQDHVTETARFLRETPTLRNVGCAFCVDEEQRWTVNYYGKPC